MLIVIAGPTGVGKSDCSLALAKVFDAEIINADSMQIYRGMDIATAKVTKEEQKAVKHHLLDIKDYDYDYSIFDYQIDARKIIDNNPDKNYIIVGGSGLYIKALLYDYKFEEEGKPYQFDEYTDEELYDMALKKDPNLKIHKNNRKRIIRFLNKKSEIVENSPLLYPDTIFIGLTMDRNLLYDRVTKRVYAMEQNGLIEEAKHFYLLNHNAKSLRTVIGYKELFPYFDGEITKEEALQNIILNTRHYIKRQYTFFNNQLDLKWFDVTDKNYLDEIISYIKSK